VKSELEERLDHSVVFTGPNIIAVGISTISTDCENIAKLIKESDIAASKLFLDGERGIFKYKQKLHIVKPFIDEISSSIEKKDFEQMDGIMSSVIHAFEHHQLGMGEVAFLWNQVVSVLVSTSYEELKDMEFEFLNYIELKERFENFDSLCSFLSDTFTYLKQLNDQSIIEGDIHSYFAQMIKYIDNHFQNRLYLKELSTKFYINQVYCCQLFKKNLGKTFSEYVTDLRMSKACELLRHTELSVEEIASEVGYFDYYYFNKVFKKQCGITPAKFRRNGLE